ncbi:MAG: prepilin-type N-terminal cleavage/methylation domain-containing protein, partial [Planctomycetota bacterium]|nr:prepilin-type N-terminal cleavage/methylation domain-containing protein [Planctomycetota bacterium]
MRPARPRHLRGVHSAPGFTLLEVVLAIVIAVVLMGAALAFYRHTLDVRAAATEEIAVSTAHRLLMDRLTEELRSATIAPVWGLGVQGQTDSISFVTATVPAGWIWAKRQADAGPAPADQDLKLVAYRLRAYPNDEGVIVVDGVARILQRVLSPEISEDQEPDAGSLIAPPIKFLRFRYYDGGGWLDAWSDAALPMAVEIILGVDPLPDKVLPEDYPYPMFRRTVFLPRSAVGGSAARPSNTSGTSGTSGGA